MGVYNCQTYPTFQLGTFHQMRGRDHKSRHNRKALHNHLSYPLHFKDLHYLESLGYNQGLLLKKEIGFTLMIYTKETIPLPKIICGASIGKISRGMKTADTGVRKTLFQGDRDSLPIGNRDRLPGHPASYVHLELDTLAQKVTTSRVQVLNSKDHLHQL